MLTTSYLTVSSHTLLMLIFCLSKQFLFTTESYDKPLFTTYFKTSLFSIYLVAFIFWRPWQRQCWKDVCRCKCRGDGREVVEVWDKEGVTAAHPTTNESQQSSIQHGEANQLNVCL